METSTHQKLREHVAKNSSIGIIVGARPTIDQMGAALALSLALKAIGKSVTVVSPTDPLVEVASLVGIDTVKKSLSGDGGDLIVSFPYREGEIDKVSYTLDEQSGLLNIVVKATDRGLTFQEKDIAYKREGGKLPPLLFFVGVTKLSDLSSVVSPESLQTSTVVNIDNLPENEGYGSIIAVSIASSSLSEQVADFLTLYDQTSHVIDADIAQNLLSGIIQATNDFQNPKTSSLALEMAGVMMRKGAVRHRRQSQQQIQSFQPVKQEQRQPLVSSIPSSSVSRPIQTYQPRPSYQPRPQQFRQEYRQNRPVQSFQNQSHPSYQSQQAQTQPVQVQSPQVGYQQSRETQPHMQQGSQPQSSQAVTSNTDQQPQQAPADWLTPKVYKGSSVVG